MKIYTLWGVRKYSPEEPELMVAWDEFCVDSNPEGYDEDCAKAIASWENDLLAHRSVTLHVPEADIQRHFERPEIKVEVEVEEP